MKPLCFVLMPFGLKSVGRKGKVNFDAIYERMIKTAIEEAGLEPIRGDHEESGGWIHKHMFERLMLCEYAVADVTGGNANVFYELGIRHALRPRSTVILFQGHSPLPFDLAGVRSLPYSDSDLEQGRKDLLKKLMQAQVHHTDSPVYTFLTDLKAQELDHSRTDLFRKHVEYSKRRKNELARACDEGAGALLALDRIRGDMGTFSHEDTGSIIDLYLSYRRVNAFERMIDLEGQMPEPLRRNRMVREQLAFALNRVGRKKDAKQILEEIIEAEGPNPETNGLLGRIFKDLRKEAQDNGNAPMAEGYLRQAIDAYLKGFEADWRDYYPGINAVTLMGELPEASERRDALIPVVAYAVEREVAKTGGTYWSLATGLELAVLAEREELARKYLVTALPKAKELGDRFAPKTTRDQLKMIAGRKKLEGKPVEWIDRICESLEAVENEMAGGAKS